MKKFLPVPILILKRNKQPRNLLLFGLFLFSFSYSSYSQCSAGYTSATVNWDNLDYFHSNGYYGTNNPVTGSPYVSSAMKQTQTFAIGTNSVSVATVIPTNNGGALSGDVTTHTGDAGGFTGADVHFIPTSAGQTITLTFQNEVQNVGFTINDIDRSAIFTIYATDNSGTLQTINYTLYASTILTAGGTSTWRRFTATNTNPGYTANTGGVTISIPGTVKTVVIKDSIIGSNAEFFLSDITACVADPGFPTSYHYSYTEPYTGQPAYFLANPQNLHVYMVNASTAEADYIFSDPGTGGTKMNSLAYDPVNHWLYYVMDNAPLPNGPPGNWTLKKYDFSTETISTVLADIRTLLVPTFEQGVEYAGAAFYNGSLYLGVEGSDGFTYSTNAESVIWRIDFDGSGTPTRASQVFATPGDNGSGTVLHDWGDFVVKDGTIITHATTTNTSQNHYIHVAMQNNTTTTYTGNAETAGQLGMTYNGNVYRIKNSIALYNNDGTIGSLTSVFVTSCSQAWSGNAGDASDPFRPKQDFGDAPSTYDPVALSPAAHQQACNNSTLRLGSVWDREWDKNTSADASGDDSDEDGVSTVTTMVSDGTPYNHVQEVTVLNNTGSDATLGGWLDYDADGVFEASEGMIVTVSSSASPQTINLAWNNITVAVGTPNSFLRIRLVSGTGSLTTSNATGWYSDGEVEDYPVISSATPLTIQLLDFNAVLTRDKNVLLTWKAMADEDAAGFEIERSRDQESWTTIATVAINADYNPDYSYTDQQPLEGRSYYRLKMVEKTGSSKYSTVRWMLVDQPKNSIKIFPNPAKYNTTVAYTSAINETATLKIRSVTGQVMLSRTVNIKQGENQMPIDITGLNIGLYIVELNTHLKTHVARITITR
jgi:hypothetical protein